MKLKKVIDTYYLENPIRIIIENNNKLKKYYKHNDYMLTSSDFNYIIKMIEFSDGVFVEVKNTCYNGINKLYKIECIDCNELLMELSLKTLTIEEFNNIHYKFYTIEAVAEINNKYNIISEKDLKDVVEWCDKNKSKLINLKLIPEHLLIDNGIAIITKQVKKRY